MLRDQVSHDVLHYTYPYRYDHGWTSLNIFSYIIHLKVLDRHIIHLINIHKPRELIIIISLLVIIIILIIIVIMIHIILLKTAWLCLVVYQIIFHFFLINLFLRIISFFDMTFCDIKLCRSLFSSCYQHHIVNIIIISNLI